MDSKEANTPMMSTLPSLRQLRYFAALAQTLNFTRAAAMCFVSQSTLSAGIKELEETLGACLVERDRQSVVLTDLGRQVLARTQGILAAAADLVAVAKQGRQPMNGILRIGVIPTLAPFVLPVLMPYLRLHYPAAQWLIREDLSANLMTRLHARQLDYVMLALPYPTEECLIEPLFDDPFWLCALHGDPLLTMPSPDLSQAVGERLLLLEEGHCLRDHSLQACSYRDAIRHSPIEATSLLTLVHMVECGLGVALIPDMAVAALSTPALAVRPLDDAAPPRQIALLARPSTPHIETFRLLADAVRTAWQQGHQGRDASA
jgi:LysR family hydrogen peroxide-inducible transcriptional activator